jgi:hypothetical protein
MTGKRMASTWPPCHGEHAAYRKRIATVSQAYGNRKTTEEVPIYD